MGSPASFLIVEDEPLVGRHLRRLVKPFGEVVLVTTVFDAKARLSDNATWCGLFIDLVLPDGSGLDILRVARASMPAVHVMVLTASIDPRLINAVHDLDAHYVVKPVDRHRVERFCRASAAARGRETAPVRPAGAGTPRDLDGCIARLRELLLLKPETGVRYEIGAIVARVKADPGAFGKNAVAAVAAALGEDLPSLYRHAAVAEAWTANEVRQLSDRRGPDGRGLSWSHIVLLGSLESEAKRQHMVERAVAEGLSVRDLAAAVKGGGRAT